MGFKSWFTGRKAPRIEADSIWLDNASRLAGLAEKARTLSVDGRVLGLAHFPKMLDAVEEALGERLSVARADSEGDVASWLAAPEPGLVGLALVDQLPAHGLDLVGEGGVQVELVRHHDGGEPEMVRQFEEAEKVVAAYGRPPIPRHAAS